MITNERQYKITRAQLSKLEQASNGLCDSDSSDSLTALSVEALASEIDILRAQLLEYEQVKAGLHLPISVTSLADLPCALIRARIAGGLTQRELAEALGWKEQQVQRYESTEYSSVSFQRLLRVAATLGLDVMTKSGEPVNTSMAEMVDGEPLDWTKFPIKDMYRRNWFENFQGSLAAAVRSAETLVGDYVGSLIKQPALAFHRKHVRSGSGLDRYSLLAWESRVLHLAQSANIDVKYERGFITSSWTENLVRLSQYDDGPLRAQSALAEVGIALVVEPHLPGTHLDGASLLKGDMPVIGLTLRFDRLDNFWFVLLHELAHAVKHLRKGKLTGTFDDLESDGVDRIEHEADATAVEALLPSSIWDQSLARYIRSEKSVLDLAKEQQIHPSIIAGRIRHEANNYYILSDLIGNAQVRRLFSGIAFST